ncbi:MAG: DUF465 domain-containing protein [Rhodobacteraceae bacterium]|nr:MAG: DUF465 domain-containing protein [Paracoccaceae bacterium]
MSLQSHLAELRRKHESLSLHIEQEQRSPSSDDLRIAQLKKEKLKLKEEIARMSGELH